MVLSLLMWECGLKLAALRSCIDDQRVTPYVGVWIETTSAAKFAGSKVVTPYVGVWIETIDKHSSG